MNRTKFGRKKKRRRGWCSRQKVSQESLAERTWLSILAAEDEDGWRGSSDPQYSLGLKRGGRPQQREGGEDEAKGFGVLMTNSF